MWYKDVTDKDGKPTGERTTTTAYSEGSDYLCGNAIPDLYGGFGTSVSFFGFDFGINFNYQIGGKIYDSGYAAAMSTPTSTGSIGVNWHKTYSTHGHRRIRTRTFRVCSTAIRTRRIPPTVS